jgi:DNA helicase-2/ATP-dependent DNA helicase PcrA
MVGLFVDILWPPVTPAKIDGLSPSPVRMDIGAQMRGMWK